MLKVGFLGIEDLLVDVYAFQQTIKLVFKRRLVILVPGVGKVDGVPGFGWQFPILLVLPRLLSAFLNLLHHVLNFVFRWLR